MVDAWVREGRTRFGNVTALNRTDGVKPIVAGLRKGEVLYLLPDMDFGPQPVDLRAVLRRAGGHRAVAVALRAAGPRQGGAGAVAKLTREGYEIEVLPAWQNFPTDDVVADTALMNQRLEGYIDTMPSQYYWVHRRFKTRPPRASRPFTERAQERLDLAAPRAAAARG